MSDLKDIRPTFLESDESGKLFAPLYFRDYQDLANTICGLNDNIDLIADLMQECAEHRTYDEIGMAIKSVTRIIKQLDMAVYTEFDVLDKLRDARRK